MCLPRMTGGGSSGCARRTCCRRPRGLSWRTWRPQVGTAGMQARHRPVLPVLDWGRKVDSAVGRMLLGTCRTLQRQLQRQQSWLLTLASC